MKLFKINLESRNRANAVDDWNEPLFVVAKSLKEVTEKYNDIIKSELISDEVEIIPTNQ